MNKIIKILSFIILILFINVINYRTNNMKLNPEIKEYYNINNNDKKILNHINDFCLINVEFNKDTQMRGYEISNILKNKFSPYKLIQVKSILKDNVYQNLKVKIYHKENFKVINIDENKKDFSKLIINEIKIMMNYEDKKKNKNQYQINEIYIKLLYFICIPIISFFTFIIIGYKNAN